MKHLAILFCIFVFSTNTLAGDLDRNEGDKSLNFSFSDFDVENYKYGIGGKYWTSNDTAITASLNLAKSELEVESTTGGGSPTGFDSESTSYGISISLEKHIKSRTSLSPYFGGEIYFSETDSDTGDSSSIATTNSQAWGINALLGAEYAFTDSIALAAEYAWGYHEGEYEYKSNTDISKNSSSGFGFYDTKLILLLYF